jgi:hypothetical protein
MRVEPVVGRPAAYDLEAVPLVEANVGHCHLGGHERQAAKAARSRQLVDPLQQPAPDAGALPRRIDSDLVDASAAGGRVVQSVGRDLCPVQTSLKAASPDAYSRVLAYFHPPDTHVRTLRAGTGIFGRYGARKFNRRP